MYQYPLFSDSFNQSFNIKYLLKLGILSVNSVVMGGRPIAALRQPGVFEDQARKSPFEPPKPNGLSVPFPVVVARRGSLQSRTNRR